MCPHRHIRVVSGSAREGDPLVRVPRLSASLSDMRLHAPARPLACALVLASFFAACRSPTQVPGATEPEDEPCRIEIDFIPDPNDGREAIFDVTIYP